MPKHFVKITVIFYANHAKTPKADPPLPMPPQPALASHDTPSLPLDHIVLAGRDAAPALWLPEGALTYHQLRSRVAQLASWLAEQRLAPGTRVASWLAKGEIASLLPLAVVRAGLVHVPVNPLLKRAQVAHILADSGAELLIGTEARLATLQPGDTAAARCIEEADVLMAIATAAPLPPSHAAPDALAAILYTSGSTGAPKGVMLSHANLWLGAETVASYLGLTAEDRVLAVLPLAFDYGQNQLLSAWFAGASVALLDYLTPRDVTQAVARLGITTLAGVPPLWHQLAEAEWPADAANSLKRLTNSGGALTEPLVRRLRARFPEANLYAMYGLTEAFRSTFLNPALIDAHPTAVGRAVPHAEVLVLRDDGTVASAGEEGEIVHCGPLVAQGYWHDETRTTERFRPAPAASSYGGTAVWSGDRGYYDADGLLHFAGRRDGQIKCAGNRISPQEVEDVALASGLIAEAVALGLPDDRLGQLVHLVCRGDAANEAALAAHLARELPNFMVPRALHWRDALPTGPNGKFDRAALLADIIGSQQ